MKPIQWEILKKSAQLETLPQIPIGLIVDSPWIPGYLGFSTLDYLTMPDIWLKANLEVERHFPEIIFLPGFWVEMGMAAEPSGFGCRVSFFNHKTPLVHTLFSDIQAAKDLPQPNPRTDGLMPIITNFYRHLEPCIKDAGHEVKVIAARGPLAVATHLMGVSDFLVGLKIDPDNTHHFLKITTILAKDWLAAQAEALSEVEGIMLLDDIVGFLSPKDYMEFAHPYLMEIFDAFPGSIKLLHNDMDNPSSYPYLGELGVQIFNFSHKVELTVARQKVGPGVCLMGNIPPLDVLTNASREETLQAAEACLRAHPGPGLILSAGGGVSPGTPAENVAALAQAVENITSGA
ncbi:MAG: uroporphyrinogen decarboxylase family protein [Anaerolineales bacterium]|jgi:uroporphyrinogen decarboxylase